MDPMSNGRSTILPGDGNSVERSRYYECLDCWKRITPTEYRATCPACGGRLRNIAVPRE